MLCCTVLYCTVLYCTCAGHGDDGPVEGLGQGVEHGAGLVLLQRVGQTSEDQHAHAHSHREQQQLPAHQQGLVELSTGLREIPQYPE